MNHFRMKPPSSETSFRKKLSISGNGELDVGAVDDDIDLLVMVERFFTDVVETSGPKVRRRFGFGQYVTKEAKNISLPLRPENLSRQELSSLRTDDFPNLDDK